MLGKKFRSQFASAKLSFDEGDTQNAVLYYRNAVACFYADEADGRVEPKDYKLLLAVCDALSKTYELLKMSNAAESWSKYSKTVMGEHDSKKRNEKIREQFLKLPIVANREAEAKSNNNNDEEEFTFRENEELVQDNDEDVPTRVLPKEPLPINRKDDFSESEQKINAAQIPKDEVAINILLQQRKFQKKPPDMQAPKEKPKEQLMRKQLRVLKKKMQRPNSVPPGMLATDNIVSGVVKHSTIINTSRRQNGSGCVMSDAVQTSLGVHQDHRGLVPVNVRA